MKQIEKQQRGMPVLTKSEVGLLLALGAGQATGYGIARQYEEDAAADSSVSNGMLYPALGRLEKWGLIEGQTEAKGRSGRGAKVYKLTSLGRMAAEWHLSSYRRLVRLGEARL